MRGDLSYLTLEAFSFSTTHSRTRMEAGFASLTTIYPIILINTENQSRARRLFTLIHEFAHVLGRISGISDLFVRKNSIERYCNHFAGAFLVPEKFVYRLLNTVT